MRDTVTAMLFIIICLLTAALVFLVYKYKKMEKMADKTMAQMDDMLEQLILGREVKYFSENEDTLPGKFQSQAGRLNAVSYTHLDVYKRQGLLFQFFQDIK